MLIFFMTVVLCACDGTPAYEDTADDTRHAQRDSAQGTGAGSIVIKADTAWRGTDSYSY